MNDYYFATYVTTIIKDLAQVLFFNFLTFALTCSFSN